MRYMRAFKMAFTEPSPQPTFTSQRIVHLTTQSIILASLLFLSKYNLPCRNWYTSPIELRKFLSIYRLISVNFFFKRVVVISILMSACLLCTWLLTNKFFFLQFSSHWVFLIHTTMSSGIGHISNSETQLNVTIKPLLLGFRIKCTILWTNSNRFYL